MSRRSALLLLLLFLLSTCGCQAEENVELPSPPYQASNSVQQESSDHDGEQSAARNKEICTGCVTKINTHVEGTSPMLEAALKDIESERNRKQILLELLDLERQIVSGVKFGLTLKVASTICARDAEILLSSCHVDETIDMEYCKVNFLQKPWLSKDKFIISNNCTSKSYTYPEALAKENLVTSEKPDHLSAEALSELESQIILEYSSDQFDFPVFDEEITTNDLDTVRDSNEENFDEFYREFRNKRGAPVSTSSSEEKVRRIVRDLNTSEESKSNETSSSEEKLRRTVRDLNTSEDSKSNDTSSSEERLRGNVNQRVTRGTQDSRAQSSLEKNDVSSNTLLKNNKKEGKASSSEEDSIIRQKRAADSSSSSSSSSSDDDNGNGNNNHDDKKDKKKEKSSKKESLKRKDDNGNGDNDNDTSSSSSSDDDNGNNNNNKKHKREVRLYNEKILIRNLARFITSTFDSKDEDDLRQIPLRVSKTKKSVRFLDGLIYDLRLKIANSNCKESNAVLYTPNLLKRKVTISDECKENLIPHTVKLCKVKVYVTESLTNPQVLDSRCHITSKGKIRNKREVLVGGVSRKPVDDPEIVNLADSTLKLLDGKSSDANKLKIVKIHEATSQIVSGVLYKIKVDIVVSDCPKTDPKHPNLCGVQNGETPKSCNIEIWSQPWLPNGIKTTVKCGDKTTQFTSSSNRSRTKRQVGKPQPFPIDDPVVVGLAQNALKQLDSESAHSNKYKVIQIHEASKQLVAGTLYKIKALIVLSDCPKSDSKDPNVCGQAKEAEPQVCEINVWTRPWIKVGGTETTIKCGEQVVKTRTRRSTPDVTTLLQDDNVKEVLNFDRFMVDFDVGYEDTKEMKKRFKIFKSNLAKIKLLNDVELGTGKYGITRFSDLTQAEFRKYYTGLNPYLRVENDVPFPLAKIPDGDIPTEFDWRKQGGVTQVKDQGSCGSCWAFSAIGNIEGQYAIRSGTLEEFSEQELVDCDTYDEGCGGGLMDNAYKAIQKLGGLESETDYPYHAKNEKCHFNKTLVEVQVTGGLNISQNEDDMARWLVKNGPISIAINANAMQFYVGGVSHPWRFLCNPKSLDHGVLIVGYGVDTFPKFNKTLPYWIVKNSWGKRWGEQGYYRVYRGSGTCGLNETPSSAILA